jgi:hypothetical protein
MMDSTPIPSENAKFVTTSAVLALEAQQHAQNVQEQLTSTLMEIVKDAIQAVLLAKPTQRNAHHAQQEPS